MSPTRERNDCRVTGLTERSCCSGDSLSPTAPGPAPHAGPRFTRLPLFLRSWRTPLKGSPDPALFGSPGSLYSPLAQPSGYHFFVFGSFCFFACLSACLLPSLSPRIASKRVHFCRRLRCEQWQQHSTYRFLFVCARPFLELAVMASVMRSVKNFALVAVIVGCSAAVSVNAQAAAPAPPPSNDVAAMVPAVVAPVAAGLLAFLAAHIF
nr:uncharacterized protein LOC112295222 [Physcomitrium patens]|eukprot:XP_024402276.1 uncharacterized protein LOC112295222 [Physcomitrella patens]